MTPTDRDIVILEWLLRCGFLVTAQIRDLVNPGDEDGAVTRHRLRKLEAAGFIVRRRAEVAGPMTSTIPVWNITEQGICQIALRKDDTRYLGQRPPCTRSWQNYSHYVHVSDGLLSLFRAISSQERVILGNCFQEHTIVNPDEDKPEKRYKLYTVVQEQPKKIICAPDAAWEFSVSKYNRAYYLELERGTDTCNRVAAKKTPGYAGLFQTKKWKLHFPNAADMRVLLVAPTPTWRDAMRKAIKNKPGAEMWLFIALTELTVESFLHGEIVYTCTDGPKPLIRP